MPSHDDYTPHQYNPAQLLGIIGFAALLGEPVSTNNLMVDRETAKLRGLVVLPKASRRISLRLQTEKPTLTHGGVDWLGKRITWADRVPDLVTWAGQQSLLKIIAKLQKALGKKPLDNLLEFTAEIHGATGFDLHAARDPLDLGYSPNDIGVPISQSPGLELLAIYGLNTVPLVSFGRRECGFVAVGKLWKFAVEQRSGSYYHRWSWAQEVGSVN